MKTTLTFLGVAVALTFSPAISRATDEEGQVRQAAAIMHRFKSMPEREIPRHVMRNAKGLAILTLMKGGFVLTGKYGEGVVVAHTGRGWSGPAFVRTGGLGVGPQIGGEVTELVLVLNTPEAVEAFATGTNVQLGGSLSVAAGPIGRTAAADVMPKAAIYTYSLSQGLFAGVSLEGTVIKANLKGNERYYGVPASSRTILQGRIAPPRSASGLMANL